MSIVAASASSTEISLCLANHAGWKMAGVKFPRNVAAPALTSGSRSLIAECYRDIYLTANVFQRAVGTEKGFRS